MSPRTIAELIYRDVPLIDENHPVGEAVTLVLDAGMPALPVVDGDRHLAGIFGEREFITALFPGYVGSLKYAAFVPKSIDAALEMRQSCRAEPVSQHMTTERVDVPSDFSHIQLAEVFIHHRVLIIPVTEGERVSGIVIRSEFFAALAERFIGDR